MRKIAVAILSIGLLACGAEKKPETTTEEIEATAAVAVETSIINEGENHFASLKQLTDGGDNAEAYWSFDDSKLVFSSK
jgi:TolB protein